MRLPSLVRSSLLLVSLVGCGLSARSQAPTPAPTLAAALAQALPPEVGVALSVGADQVTRPQDGVLPGTTATVNDVASAYGRLVRHFGDVAAVAPPTMTVVSVPPDKPDPFDGMPPADVMRLLAGSLTDAQWDKLYGAQGLGLDDLTSETQRGLFAALFPGGKLQVLGEHYSWPPKPDQITDLSAEIPRCRLRLGQSVSIALPIEGKPTSHLFAGQEAPPGAPKQYTDYSNDSFAQDYLAGARVRSEEPNAPKRGTA